MALIIATDAALSSNRPWRRAPPAQRLRPPRRALLLPALAPPRQREQTKRRPPDHRPPLLTRALPRQGAHRQVVRSNPEPRLSISLLFPNLLPPRLQPVK